MPDFTSISLWLNIAIFAGAAASVWFAGVRITGHAETISRKTGIGHAAIGMILLAGVTSLPEIGVTLTASLSGNSSLAINNLFGSIAMQVTVLALVDFTIGHRALTAVVPEPRVMLQGVLNIILLAFVAAGMVVNDVGFFGIGLWAWGCLGLYIASIWLLSREQDRRPWLAARKGKVEQHLLEEGQAKESEDGAEDLSLSGLIWRTTALALVILVAGYLLSQTGDAIARQTGLGASFVGFVLVAISTSLPELSTALTAARRGLFTLAISDILGTNLINVGLVFVIDAASSGQPVLNTVGSFSIFGALLGIIVTALFLGGLAERRDTTIARIGLDSAIVTIVYLGGLVLLYQLR
ncbi:sodium:calcium exchanger [Paramesorhizobium deserti]|uniref:Sodium:calcium exchanger n=1 Tax=Paramesorhizobium deserti TaxID=1494590 RepID=A0A135HV38_9HYPH|nr:sodium:calcium antiporter [Paramesorhizobium deserti]KXF77050.1 sodium:calcium exchanger [Paramesorhizobium deserti]